MVIIKNTLNPPNRMAYNKHMLNLQNDELLNGVVP